MDFLFMGKNIKTLPEKTILSGDQFVVYLDFYTFEKIQLRVEIGDYVFKGQMLVEGKKHIVPIHAPTSGQIVDIKRYVYDLILNKYRIEFFLISDGKDISKKLFPIHHYKKINRESIIKLIYQNGIVGLGGALFPTTHKLYMALHNNVDTLIINSLESEPYITADKWLMKNYASDILKGCEIIQWILKVKNVIIAIADDKDDFFIKINKEVLDYPGFQLRFIKKKYPSGSSKQLIKLLTGKEIPHNGHATNLGIVMYNVGTVYAVKKAVIEGEPLISRAVTITGGALTYSGNMWVRFGVSINDLLMHLNYFNLKNKSVIVGGPLMGSEISNIQTPVLKGTNCILIPSDNEIKKKGLEQPCIRCGKCSNGCPMKLLPQQLYWYSKGLNHNKTKEYKIKDCIECGICEQVCPSDIPLLNYFRKEKRILKEIEIFKKKSKEAKDRFQKKQFRLNSRKIISIKNILFDSTFNFEKNDIFENIFEKKLIKKSMLKKEKEARKKSIHDAIERVKNKKINFN
ncbi:electron transport complex subunit RsxC [Buchnera aphidicola (Pemphigus obesinymphae)]|nr:electron transport complex subunit RsxC [Buchnera aphidicola (Pemphigus obesinymphae)]